MNFDILTLRNMSVVYARNFDTAVHFRDKGYEPVECSFEDKSVVGRYLLDHHGEHCDQEPVSIKAAKLSMHATAPVVQDFVVTGLADPDLVYTLLALSGNIRPNLEIATSIAELDLDPVAMDRTQQRYIRQVLFDRGHCAAYSPSGVLDALRSGLHYFQPRDLSDSEIMAAKHYEAQRIATARQNVRVANPELDLAYVVDNGIGMDVWHERATIVLQYKPMSKVLTIGGCPKEGARRLGKQSIFDMLGPEGFFNGAYALLDRLLNKPDGMKGSGGRRTLGGSPRGLEITAEQADHVYAGLRAWLSDQLPVKTKPASLPIAA